MKCWMIEMGAYMIYKWCDFERNLFDKKLRTFYYLFNS